MPPCFCFDVIISIIEAYINLKTPGKAKALLGVASIYMKYKSNITPRTMRYQPKILKSRFLI